MKKKIFEYTKLNATSLQFKMIKRIPLTTNNKIDYTNPILNNEN